MEEIAGKKAEDLSAFISGYRSITNSFIVQHGLICWYNQKLKVFICIHLFKILLKKKKKKTELKFSCDVNFLYDPLNRTYLVGGINSWK